MSWAERLGGQHRPISLVVAPPNGEKDRLSGGGSPRLPTRPADTHQLCLCHRLRHASSWMSPTSILPCILLSLCLRSFFPVGLLVARAQDGAYGAWCLAEQTTCGSSYGRPRSSMPETGSTAQGGKQVPRALSDALIQGSLSLGHGPLSPVRSAAASDWKQCTIKVMSLNHPETTPPPPPPVQGKTVFHEIGPWYQKG